MKASRTGFTLIELIIVLCVLGITTGLAMPRLFSTWEKAKFQENLNKIVFFLRENQLEAISKTEKIFVVLGAERREFTRRDGTNLILPRSINVRPKSDKDYMRRKEIGYIFYPNGRVVGAELLVTGEHNRKAMIYIEPLTGQAKCVLQ